MDYQIIDATNWSQETGSLKLVSSSKIQFNFPYNMDREQSSVKIEMQRASADETCMSVEGDKIFIPVIRKLCSDTRSDVELISNRRPCENMQNPNINLILNKPRKAPMDTLNTTNLITASPYLEQSSSTTDMVPLSRMNTLQKCVVCLNHIKRMSTEERKFFRSMEKQLRMIIQDYIRFDLPKYKNEYTNSGNEWFRRSALYATSGNIHTDRKLTVLPRQTQGFGIPLAYLSEAVTAVASAFTYYLMYKTGKNAYHSIKEHTYGIQSAQVMSALKTYMLELIGAMRIIYCWYTGQVTLDQALLMLLGLGGWIAAKHYLLSALLPTLKPFPADSTTRETQAFDPPSLAHSIISILILLGLGSGSTLDAKSVMGSIRGLSATLLTVKTVENVFMAVITYLPDIIQVFVCDHFPVFGQYMYMTTNTLYRRFVEVSHDLMSRSVTDVLFNSHNLAKFLQYRDICKNIVMDKTAFKVHLYKTIPEILSWYDLMYRRAEELGLLPGKRKLPFVIWLSGDPGIGKSTMVKELAEIGIGHLFKDLTPDEKDQGIVNFLRSEEISKYVYTHNTSNKYFDGYNNQPIFVLNDYLQFTQEKEEQWLIRFVDTNDCPLEVSSVDNPATGVKGEVRFTSRIIIVTSNISHLYNSTVVTNLDAFNRRRDFVVNMNWKENVRQVDFRNFDYSWCNFTKHPALPHSNALIVPFKDKIDFWQCLSHELTMYLYQTGHMHLDHAHPTQQATIKDALASMESFEYQWDLKLWATWNEIMKKAETKFFGIPLKYLLPLIVGGTSATYLIYKSWVPSLLAQLTTQSMSGDMATQRLQKKTKPLTRTTMSNRQNDTELALRICKNMVRITTVIKDVHNKLITQVVWGWSYGGSMILTPKHLWKRGESEVQIGDIVAIERGSSQFFFTVERDNIYMDPDSDIAVINVSGDVPPFKSEKNLVIGGEFQVDEAGEDGMILIMTKGPQTDEAIVPTIVPVRAYLTDAPYSDEYGVTYEGRNIWQYNHRLVKGDCGAPMLINTKAGMKIAGIHVAGDAFSGNSEVITQAVLDQADQYFTKRKTQGFCTDAEFVEEEFFDAESDLEGNFFYLGKVKTPPYQKSDTQIVKSPLFEALQPHMTEPAVLSPTDKRMDSVMSPIISSVSKYGQQVLPFNMDLMNAAFDIVLDMYQPIKIHKLKVFSHEEAINAKYTPNLEKLDLTTSAGYPWNTKGKSKKDLFNKDKDGYITIKPELQNVINKNENLLDKKTMFPYTLVTTLKDERVSLKKVKIGKTRTFMNFPVEYTVMMRRYFDDFIDKETFHAMEIGTTVGVNIYSSQWHQLFLKLNEFDCVTDGDFKAFDGTIRPEFFKFYSRLVNSFYKDEFSNHRHLLCVGCCFAPMFVLDKVYMKLQGNPSGSRLTTSFNSFVNRMYVVMSMLKNIPTQYRNRVFFNENVKIFAHGDDHIIGFNNIVLDSWDAHTLRDFMKVHGIDYTSSNKDQELARHRPLNQCFYLKSHFVYNKETGMYQAGLDKEVIQEMVSWQRDNSLESTEMIVQTAQRYAYFWGREYFTEIYNKLEDIIIKKRLRINLIDYNSLDQYYLYNGQMDFSYV